jgi:hypothetical protein
MVQEPMYVNAEGTFGLNDISRGCGIWECRETAYGSLKTGAGERAAKRCWKAPALLLNFQLQ